MKQKKDSRREREPTIEDQLQGSEKNPAELIYSLNLEVFLEGGKKRRCFSRKLQSEREAGERVDALLAATPPTPPLAQLWPFLSLTGVSEEDLLRRQAAQARPAPTLGMDNSFTSKDECCRAPRANHAISAAAGLLSSSCCLLQLGTNALSLGCAGFNKLLGPSRPQLRFVTACWLIVLWILTITRRWSKRQAAISTLLCAGLTFMPEVLLAAGGRAFAPSMANTFSIRLNIDGMGCEACQWHVRSVLERTAGVVSSDVDFNRGIAKVVVAEGWGFNITQLALILKQDGYEIVGSEGSSEDVDVVRVRVTAAEEHEDGSSSRRTTSLTMGQDGDQTLRDEL